jgi:hypothetical protein
LIKFYRFKPNIEKAQAKQKNNFAKRKNKGVRVFQLSLGDLVLRKVMKNISRKGGKLDALWNGPYRYDKKYHDYFIRVKFFSTGCQCLQSSKEH